MIKTRIAFAALAAMLVATLAWSASSFNSSKSNVYPVSYTHLTLPTNREV